MHHFKKRLTKGFTSMPNIRVGKLQKQLGKRGVASPKSKKSARAETMDSTDTRESDNIDIQVIAEPASAHPQPPQEEQKQHVQPELIMHAPQSVPPSPTSPRRAASPTKTHPVPAKPAASSPDEFVILDVQPDAKPVERVMSGRTVHLLNQQTLDEHGDSSDDDEASVSDEGSYSEVVTRLRTRLEDQQFIINDMHRKLNRVSQRQGWVLIAMLLVIASVLGLMAAVFIIANHVGLV